MVGTLGIQFHGCCRNSSLHIGQFLELVDDNGIPPTVEIISPVEGDEFFEGQIITFEVNATDDVLVAAVTFLVDGEVVATDTAAPFVALLPAPLGQDSVSLSARAIDLGDNVSDLATRVVTVLPDVPPEIAITSPSQGDAFIEGTTITLRADATDNVQVVRVEFRTDSGFVQSDFNSPFEVQFTVPLGVNQVVIEASAFDNLSKKKDAAPVVIQVTPDPPPVVNIVTPQNGETLIEGSTIAIRATAVDNVAVTRVDFFVNGAPVGSDDTSPFEVGFVVPSGINQLTFEASAVDNLGNVGVAAPVVTNVIPDPLTTVIGVVVDPDDIPVEGAELSTNGDVTGFSLANGSFSLPNVPTILGDIVVAARVQRDEEKLFGRSGPFPPVPDGVTNVGVIEVSAALELFAVSPRDALFRVINPEDASTISAISMTLPGKTVLGGTGLATDPLTGELWVMLRVSGSFGRELVTINPDTGVATSVGNTGDRFTGLAFDGAGTLFGVTGNGADIPESLFTLRTSDATPTLVLRMPQCYGESIGFNPDDAQMYRASGAIDCLPIIFEAIDLETLNRTPVPLSGDQYSEGGGLTFWESEGVFLISEVFAGMGLYRVTPDGVVTFVGEMDVEIKGLAFAPR